MKKLVIMFSVLLIVSVIYLINKKSEPEKINIINEALTKNNDQIKQYMQGNYIIDYSHQRKGDGTTALHIAVENNNVDLIKLVIDKHADMYIRDKKEKSVLEAALLSGNDEIKHYLLDLICADNLYFNHNDNIGKMIIDLYKNDKNYKKSTQKIIDLFLLREIGYGLILKNKINYDNIEHLISIGANINGVGSHFDRTTGIHPVYLASSNNNIRLVKYLLAKGAEVNIHFDDEPGDTISGETPLICAIKSKNNIIARLLIKNGADINLKAEFNNSPLSVAKSFKNKEMEKYLVKLGAKE